MLIYFHGKTFSLLSIFHSELDGSRYMRPMQAKEAENSFQLKIHKFKLIMAKGSHNNIVVSVGGILFLDVSIALSTFRDEPVSTADYISLCTILKYKFCSD